MQLFVKHSLKSKESVKELLKFCSETNDSGKKINEKYCSDKNLVAKYVLRLSGYKAKGDDNDYSDLFTKIFKISSEYSIKNVNKKDPENPYWAMKNTQDFRKYMAGNTDSEKLINFLELYKEFPEDISNRLKNKYPDFFKKLKDSNSKFSEKDIINSASILKYNSFTKQESDEINNRIREYMKDTKDEVSRRPTLF
jgi:hypothetical protein